MLNNNFKENNLSGCGFKYTEILLLLCLPDILIYSESFL